MPCARTLVPVEVPLDVEHLKYLIWKVMIVIPMKK